MWNDKKAHPAVLFFVRIFDLQFCTGEKNWLGTTNLGDQQIDRNMRMEFIGVIIKFQILKINMIIAFSHFSFLLVSFISAVWICR